MEFKEFKEKYFGKSVEEIKEGLKEEKDFWKNNVELVNVCVNADKIVQNIIELNKNHPSLYIFQKKMMLLKYIYENFTNLKSFPEEDSFEDYDINVERVFYEVNKYAIFLKDVVNESLIELHNIVLEQLYQIFNTKIPTVEEIEKIQNELDNLFKNESPEKLKIIDSILAFNDPSLKAIKDDLYSNGEDLKLIKNKE